MRSVWHGVGLMLAFLTASLTLGLPVSSADNLGKQFGPRSGPTNLQA